MSVRAIAVPRWAAPGSRAAPVTIEPSIRKRARAGERFAVTRARVVRDAAERELDGRAAIEVVALKALVEGVEDRRRLLLCGRATASRLRRDERPEQRLRGIA